MVRLLLLTVLFSAGIFAAVSWQPDGPLAELLVISQPGTVTAVLQQRAAAQRAAAGEKYC